MSLKQAAFHQQGNQFVVLLRSRDESDTNSVGVMSIGMSTQMSNVPYGEAVSRSLAKSSEVMMFHAILQAVVELALGIIFYRFGPRVAGFLMGTEEAVVVDAVSDGLV